MVTECVFCEIMAGCAPGDIVYLATVSERGET
jgi:hypothetical protein